MSGFRSRVGVVCDGVLCALVLVTLVRLYVNRKPVPINQATANDPATLIDVGSSLKLPRKSWATGKRHLVILAQSGCRACEILVGVQRHCGVDNRSCPRSTVTWVYGYSDPSLS